MNRILLSIVCAGALLVPALADSPDEQVRKAPDLTWKLPGKGEQSLGQYRGKVVALEFIFTTCPHCQAASKYMTQLQGEYGSKGLQVIDIAVNPNADLLVENFTREFGVNFPVGWASLNDMMSFMGFNANDRPVVPQLALIDRKGNIHWQTPPTSDDGKWERIMDHGAIKQHIEQLLSQPLSRSPAVTSNRPAAAGKSIATAKKAS